jgi:hypothetical protein
MDALLYPDGGQHNIQGDVGAKTTYYFVYLVDLVVWFIWLKKLS